MHVARVAHNFVGLDKMFIMISLINDNLRWTPESPRLRLTQGRVDEAEKIITKVMRANKREIPDEFRQDHIETSLMSLKTTRLPI